MDDYQIALLFGVLIGFLAGMLPHPKTSCWLLLIVPAGMIFYTMVELSDPGRSADALDGLLYLFNPLWAGLAGLAGFGLARILYRLVNRKRPR